MAVSLLVLRGSVFHNVDNKVIGLGVIVLEIAPMAVQSFVSNFGMCVQYSAIL